MHLRASTTKDVDALFGIWERSVAATHDFVLPEDLASIASLVRDQYLPNANFTLVCDDDGRVLGFMGLYLLLGVGRLLIERARQLSPTGLTVEVNEDNGQAAGFYARMGFRVTGRMPLDHQGRPYPLLQLAWTRRENSREGDGD